MSLDDLRRQQEKEFERQKVLAPAVASRMALARQFFIECLPAITEEVQRRSGLQRLSSGWQEDDHAEMSGYLSVPGVERGIEFRTTGGIRLAGGDRPYRIVFSLMRRTREGQDILFETDINDLVLPIVIRSGVWTSGMYRLEVRQTYHALWRCPEDNDKITAAVVSLLEGEGPASEFNPSAFRPEYRGSPRCLIADAVYGRSDAPEVTILRRVRDEVLLPSAFGRMLFRGYVRFAPGLANYVGVRPSVCRVFRILLAPVVRAAHFLVGESHRADDEGRTP